MKIDLHFICHNEGHQLRSMLDSAMEAGFDRIVAGLTAPALATEDILKQYGVDVYGFKWCDDFSAARNFVLEKCTGDYVMWLDADDILVNPWSVRPIIEQKVEGTDINMVAAPYDYYSDGDLHFYRERIIRRGTHVWRGRIHETLRCTTKLEGARTNEFYVLHNAIPVDRWERNLRLSMMAIREERTPETIRHYAQSLLGYGAYHTARKAFEEYLQAPEAEKDLHAFALAMLCDACANMKDWAAEEKYGRMLIELSPALPVGYYRVANALQMSGDTVGCMEMLKKGREQQFLDNMVGYHAQLFEDFARKMEEQKQA